MSELIVTDDDTKLRVSYLIGAGGSHACVKSLGCPHGILMADLASDLVARTKQLVDSSDHYSPLRDIVNEIVEENTDFEHLITFFDESPSSLHRAFAEGLRCVFESVLIDRLRLIEQELGNERANLYASLFDMYNIEGIDETLHGVMTLNYDDYIEVAAAEVFDILPVDLNFGTSGNNSDHSWLVKLHGSFGWEDTWPIRRRTLNSNSRPLWIPPGIRKAKERYPFNLLWGRARGLLDCDVLRVIGCNLGPSDWDLVSLLFGTRIAHHNRDSPYVVEIIDNPKQAFRLQDNYPYLSVRSLFEIDRLDVGRNLVGENLGTGPRSYEMLSASESNRLMRNINESDKNWFRQWLIQMGEGLQATLGVESTNTEKGVFRRYLGI